MMDSSFSQGDPTALFVSSMSIIPFAYWLGGVLEGFGAKLEPRDLALHAGRVSGARILSIVVGYLLVNIAIPSGAGTQSQEPDGSWG